MTTPKMATCPKEGAPLIMTMMFSGAEFYCIECGAQYGYFDPAPADPTTELDARYEALKAEWDEHVGSKLVVINGWHTDCPKCESRNHGYHSTHATAEQWTAHEEALAWLRKRAGLPEPEASTNG